MAAVIDIHTHAFPDDIARKAIPALEKEGGIKAYLDGTVAGLLDSMDRSGVQRSVLCSIATKPEQFDPILQWSRTIRSDRIEPFPSLHPEDPQLLEHLETIHAEGFKGVKMHSYYQDYFLDDVRLFPLYERMSQLGTILVIHAGYDIAFPRIRKADPGRIVEVCRQFPGLKLIATHLGGWDEWSDVRDLLAGKPIYMEISFALDFLDQKRLKEIMLAHPAEYLLFGTDSPWTDQATTLKMLARLKLPDPLFERIVGGNACRLLGERAS
ncbi:MAG: amidohydrolase [Desulfobulbus sp.]|jgi:predicted TIM-barrel fold metal-dependent hydrolase|uniref:amidohydrolase family protein n=1 Tax=Desulfobulbus sp. TaxID=895 RepID=UPI00283E0A53|nr:amidohydrolase family protein [Desulfobulbus sp.]MDR2551102.1 amidohydrolase [Desulfobulbus sp.]